MREAKDEDAAETAAAIEVTLEQMFGDKRGRAIARHAAKRRGADELAALESDALERMARWFARTPRAQIERRLGERYESWLLAKRALYGLASKLARREADLLDDDERRALLEDGHAGLKVRAGVSSYHQLDAEALCAISRELGIAGVGLLFEAAELTRSGADVEHANDDAELHDAPELRELEDTRSRRAQLLAEIERLCREVVDTQSTGAHHVRDVDVSRWWARERLGELDVGELVELHDLLAALDRPRRAAHLLRGGAELAGSTGWRVVS